MKTNENGPLFAQRAAQRIGGGIGDPTGREDSIIPQDDVVIFRDWLRKMKRRRNRLRRLFRLLAAEEYPIPSALYVDLISAGDVVIDLEHRVRKLSGEGGLS